MNCFELEITKARAFEFFYFLRDHESLRFDQLIDINVYDRLSERKRFNLVYIFASLINNLKIFVSLQTSEGNPIFSIIDLFEGAS
jgi:NADH:ubiquinone oxidoreductase subunit C